MRNLIQFIVILFLLTTNIIASENQKYTNNIIIKLSNEKNLNSYLSEFDIEFDKKLGSNIYLLKVKNRELLLDIADKLNQKQDVFYAHPDYIKQMIPR